MIQQILPKLGQDLFLWTALNLLLSLAIVVQGFRILRFERPRRAQTLQTHETSAQLNPVDMLGEKDDRILIVNIFPIVFEAALRRFNVPFSSSTTYREALKLASDRINPTLLSDMSALYGHYEAGRFGVVDPPINCRVLLMDVVSTIFGGRS